MFLLDFFNSSASKGVSKLARESVTYNAFYIYWRDELFERVMRLFVWENTYDEKEKLGVKPKEIEQRLILRGHCGITKINPNSVANESVHKDELVAMFGTFHGVSKYFDEKLEYTVRCPIYAGNRIINKDVIVIDANSLRNPIYPLIHHYAVLLAHVEVTLADILINARDAGGVPIAQNEKQKQSIEQYQGRIFNGQYGVITDPSSFGVNYAGTDRKTSQDISQIVITREKILKSFYSDIGVRSAFEKRSNSVEAEVEADTSLLLLNLSDMLDSRKKGCEAVNELFGTNWSVHIAEEIDYGTENERIQFNAANTIHMVNAEMEGTGNEENDK